MGYYVNLRCQNCGYSFTGGYVRTGISDNLGLPIVVCPKCRTPHKTGKKLWSQMTRADRSKYVFSRIVQTLINALGIAVPCFAGYYYLLKPETEADAIVLLVLTGISALGLSALLIYFNSRHAIKKLEKESKKRDSDAVVV